MATPLLILLLTFALGSAAQDGGDQPRGGGGGLPSSPTSHLQPR